jgi:hypothetical protein
MAMTTTSLFAWIILALALTHFAGFAAYIYFLHWDEWKGLGEAPKRLALLRVKEISDEASRWPIAVLRKMFR